MRRQIQSRGKSINLKLWNLNEGKIDRNLNTKEWIRLTNLPELCWNFEVLKEVLSGIGILLQMDLANGKKFDHSFLDVEIEKDDSVPIPKTIDIIVGNANYVVAVKPTSKMGDLKIDEWNSMKFNSNTGKVWRKKEIAVNTDDNLIDLDITTEGVVVTHVNDASDGKSLHNNKSPNKGIHTENIFNVFDLVVVEDTETDSDDANAIVFRADNQEKVDKFIRNSEIVITGGPTTVEVDDTCIPEEDSAQIITTGTTSEDSSVQIVEVIKDHVPIINISDNSLSFKDDVCNIRSARLIGRKDDTLSIARKRAEIKSLECTASLFMVVYIFLLF